MQSLLYHNTFGIDQGCRQLYEPSTVAEVRDLLPLIISEPLLIIGGGSNLLLTKDFEGNVLHPTIKGIEVVKDNPDNVYVRCGAGETWDDVVAYCVNNNYHGIENLSLIPGEVGASAVQNIGAYGVEVKDVINNVEAIDILTGKDVIIENAECNYSYRYSKFKDEWKGRYVVTYVTYKLSKVFVPRLDYGNLKGILSAKGKENPSAIDVRNAVIEIRNEKLPDIQVEGNAGSFFMNPIVKKSKYNELAKLYPNMPYYVVDDNNIKIPAGWMIEQCGWKGKTLGRAGVHSRQALVLVNKGGATGAEVVALCEAIRADVKEKFGIVINPEVNII